MGKNKFHAVFVSSLLSFKRREYENSMELFFLFFSEESSLEDLLLSSKPPTNQPTTNPTIGYKKISELYKTNPHNSTYICFIMKSKALLLLIIFLLNTAVGLACALHMELKHTHHHHHQNKSCCKTTVNTLVTQAKAIPETQKILPQSPAILKNFQYDFYTVSLEIPHTNTKPSTNHHHPPIPDIRIAVQSFQI